MASLETLGTETTGAETSAVAIIGATAGVVWKTLAVQGPTSLTKLIKETGAPRDAVLQALGWLAREDKIEVEDGRTKRFSLKYADAGLLAAIMFVSSTRPGLFSHRFIAQFTR